MTTEKLSAAPFLWMRALQPLVVPGEGKDSTRSEAALTLAGPPESKMSPALQATPSTKVPSARSVPGPKADSFL